ncbi:MAG: 16S rRNA (cytosine(1402)-N(4))-methyltransferase RsmH [Oscillospiraceae bacterium]
MDNNEQQPKHVRRVRYSGTHPKNFDEKYKELQPEKYKEAVAKIIEDGKTPAGMHISICVNEILDFLQIKPGQVGLDATLGYGGHTQKMLERLGTQGHIYAIDVDPIESKKTKARLENLGFTQDMLTVKLLNFSDIDKLSKEVGKFDFVLADLGLSSMQIDNPKRGFTYKYEGPLDLRMNPNKGISAAERLKNISQPQLEGMLDENADEPYALEISRAIIGKIKRKIPIETTTALRETIEEALSFLPANTKKDLIKKSCQRTFQALRIDVNGEFEALFDFLEKLPDVLCKGGRVAILTFHSGEDRFVKKSFKRFFSDGIYSDIAKDVIRPTPQECFNNSRAHSAKLRWAIKA